MMFIHSFFVKDTYFSFNDVISNELINSMVPVFTELLELAIKPSKTGELEDGIERLRR